MLTTVPAVVVADDSVLLREGIVRLLDEAGFEVVAQAGDAEDLLRKVGAHRPDVAVVDIRMPPDQHRRRPARRARDPRRATRHVGCWCSPSTSRRATRWSWSATPPAGSATCSRTGWPTWSAFVDAVRRVAEGGSALDPEVVSQLLGPRAGATTRWRAHPARARGARS